MDEKVRSFDLSNQTAGLQLFTFFVIVNIGGALLFYLFLFTGSLIFGTGISDMLRMPTENPGIREVSILKYMQVSQQVTIFVIPALILSRWFRRSGESYMKMDKQPGANQVLLVILLALLFIPVTGYTGMLNSKMVLPEGLSGITDWMKAKEDMASTVTGLLLNSPGRGGIFLNVLIMALIPSVAEELIFRGVLQQILCKLFKSSHIGIWVTALLFSAIHLQFYGFLPRLILGLSFGYLFFWGRSLWLPVIAHFINNVIPVVLSFYYGWNALSEKTDYKSEKEIFLPLLAGSLSILIFLYFRNEYRKSLIETH
jgi:uncharacterized protein